MRSPLVDWPGVREPIRNSGGNVDLLLELERLRGFPGRAAGTDAERRAAKHLAARLEQLGRGARLEPVRVRPAFALTHLMHAGAGLVGSVLSVYVPIAGLALVLVAAISAFGDLTASFFLARLATPIRATQNVVSAEDEGKPGRLILVARYDAGRSGTLFGDRLRRWPTVFCGSLVVIAICAAARVIGLDATWLTVIQFVPTVVLIAAFPLLGEVALAEPGPGENRNASGAATVLGLAERYGGRLEHFDLTVLLTGAGHPTPLGMRGWIGRRRRELDPETTAVVCVEAAAFGTPHYATREGTVLPTRFHPTLTAICDELESATPYVSHELSDAYVARSAGLPAIRVSALGARDRAPESVDADALARTFDFLAALVERIDEEIGPRLGA